MTRDAERWLEDVLRQAGEAATPGAPELARAFQGVKQRLRAAPAEGGEGSAIVGHHDRRGLSDTKEAKSWNSSHATRGCDMASLRATGGGGLIYCFAAN